MPSNPNDPGGRNYKSSMSSYWTRLFNLLQHEAGHFVVILEGEKQYKTFTWWNLQRSSPSGEMMWSETFPKILTACLHQEQLMATISLLWKVNFCWKPCTDKMYGTSDIFIYKSGLNWLMGILRVYASFLAVKILRYLPTLFAFAFLPPPMHPVMTHCNGLNMKTDHKISFLTRPTCRTTGPKAVAKLTPLIDWRWKGEAHLAKISRAGFPERRFTPEINLEGSRGKTERCKYRWKSIPSSLLDWIQPQKTATTKKTYNFFFKSRATTTMYRELSFSPQQQGYSTCNCHHEEMWPPHLFSFNLRRNFRCLEIWLHSLTLVSQFQIMMIP